MKLINLQNIFIDQLKNKAIIAGLLIKKYYHPLFIMPIVLAIIWIFKDISLISKIYKNRIFWISMATVFIVVWAVRMFNMFPDIPPLDFNRYALIPVIYDLIRHIIR